MYFKIRLTQPVGNAFQNDNLNSFWDIIVFHPSQNINCLGFKLISNIELLRIINKLKQKQTLKKPFEMVQHIKLIRN